MSKLTAEFVAVDPKLMADALADLETYADEVSKSVVASDGDHGGKLEPADIKASLLLSLLLTFDEGVRLLGYKINEAEESLRKEKLAKSTTLPVSSKKKPVVH